MSELVPIVEHKLPEARIGRELLAGLYKTHRIGLPGLVVRASGLIDCGAVSHEEIREAVVHILNGNSELGWVPEGQGVTTVLGNTEKGPGDLHHDALSHAKSSFRVQRTTSGAGYVLMATSGELGFEYPWQLEDEANDNFQNGKVDPQIVSPDFYVADLDVGDNVIFLTALPPDHDKAGPIWHAFGTYSEARQGVIKTIPLADWHNGYSC